MHASTCRRIRIFHQPPGLPASQHWPSSRINPHRSIAAAPLFPLHAFTHTAALSSIPIPSHVQLLSPSVAWHNPTLRVHSASASLPRTSTETQRPPHILTATAMHGRERPQKHAKKREPTSSSSAKLPKSTSIDSLSAAITAADSSGPPTSRRSSRRKGTAEDDFPDDDSASTTSTSSTSDTAAAADSPDLNNSNRLHDAIEGLGEKRSSIRTTALNNFIALLTATYVPQLLEPQQETLSHLFVASLKKGDSAEAALASHALSLLAVSLPEGNDTVWRAAGEALHDAMRNKSKSIAVRAAAARTFTFLRFLLAEHDDECVDTMSELLTLLPASPVAASAGHEEFEVAVMEGWGLLACAVSSHLLSSFLVRVMPLFTAYLHSESVEVRMAVGENIAMLFSAYHDHNTLTENGDDGDADGAEDEAAAAAAPSAGPLSPVDHHHRRPQPEPPCTTPAQKLSILQSTLHHDLLPLLSTLSTDSSRHRARKDRREQRASFRDVLASVETGEQPSVSVTIKKQKVVLEGWRAVRVWDAIRQVVGGGVGVHLSENELVAGLIGWEGEDEGPDGEDVDERTKRLDARAASKSRAKEAYQLHNKQRSKKTQHLDSSLY